MTNKGTFNNDGGIIVLDSVKLDNDGEFAEFTNNGEIKLQLYNATLINQNGAIFKNEGEISITDLPSVFLGAISHNDPNSSFLNTGSIEISNTGFNSTPNGAFGAGILVDDSAVFDNQNLISFQDLSGPGINVSIDGFFMNSGIIDVNSGMRHSGIRVIGNSFINQSGGIININDVAVAGLVIGTTTFINETNATININSGGEYIWPTSIGAGIFFYGGELKNKGKINIGNDIRGPAIQTRSTNAIINNLEGGEINIEQAGTHGVAFERGNFNNSGKVVFGKEIIDEIIYRYRDEEFFTNLDSGHVWGIGTIDTAVFINQGSIHPGISPGIIDILDSYDHTLATYEVEIAGTGGAGAVDGHDLINVEDTAILGGNCYIKLIDGFSPKIGDSFVIMTCGGLCNGIFDFVSLQIDTSIWEIEYNTNDIVLNFINAPPEFTSSPILIATEDQPYQYQITASDPNLNDSLIFTSSQLPSWLSLFDNKDGTAELSGTPANNDVGDTTITLTVTDKGGCSPSKRLLLRS